MTKHCCDLCETPVDERRYLAVQVFNGELTLKRDFCDYRCLSAWAQACAERPERR